MLAAPAYRARDELLFMINRYDMRHARLWPINNTQWPESHDRTKSALRGPKALRANFPKRRLCGIYAGLIGCVVSGGATMIAGLMSRAPALAVLLAIGATVAPARAQDAIWRVAPGTNNWNTPETGPRS